MQHVVLSFMNIVKCVIEYKCLLDFQVACNWNLVYVMAVALDF